ncbi:MAG: DegV family protein [Anaerolineae bacterium]|nr:DegV family protein [Anaerolineae bacterium]
MGKVRIVTDSSAHFLSPDILDRYDIQVVPQTIQLGSRQFREGVDLDAEAFFRLAGQGLSPIKLSAPPVDEFAVLYSRLNRETDQILSLHMSRYMSKTWDHAHAASKTLLGRCEIIAIDSMTTSVGLAMLVEAAAITAEQNASLEEVVRIVRGMLPHIYMVFFVNTLDFLRKNGLLSQAQSILGTMLDIKPFLTIEEGELITMEKVRTQIQAIDKLVEFVAEFSTIDDLVILQNAPFPTDQTRMLQDRLSVEFPSRTFPLMMYGPSLATMVGLDGMGIVVREGLEAEDEF